MVHFIYFNQNQKIVHSRYLKKNQKQRTTKGVRYLEKRKSENQRTNELQLLQNPHRTAGFHQRAYNLPGSDLTLKKKRAVIVYRKQVFEFFISMTMIVYQNRVWIFWEPRSWTRWSALIPGGCLVQYLLAHGTRGLFSSSRMDRFLDTSEDTHFHVPGPGKSIEKRKEKQSRSQDCRAARLSAPVRRGWWPATG